MPNPIEAARQRIQDTLAALAAQLDDATAAAEELAGKIKEQRDADGENVA